MSPPDKTQRLMPRLAYIDAAAAIAFLCEAFGFEETGRFAPNGEVVYSELALNGETLFAVGTAYDDVGSPKMIGANTVDLFCFVDDVDRHFAQAELAGAEIISPPEDKFWGDRSYDARDTEGFRWTFRKIVMHVDLPDSRPSAS